LPARLLQLPQAPSAGTLADARKGTRQAYSGIARDFVPFTVYDRYALSAGATFDGPAIVEERESTLVIGEDAAARVDQHGFLWIDLPSSADQEGGAA
jgi:N-methylhydantoinase A